LAPAFASPYKTTLASGKLLAIVFLTVTEGEHEVNSPILLIVVTVLYFLEAIRLAYIGQSGLGLTFFGYTIANFGLIWAVMENTK